MAASNLYNNNEQLDDMNYYENEENQENIRNELLLKLYQRKIQIEKITEVDEEYLDDESIINSNRQFNNMPKINYQNKLIFQESV